MTQKILFEGWDDLSSEEQEAMQAWLKGITDAQLAKRRFLNLFFSHNSQNLEGINSTLLSDINSTIAEENYIFVSSTSEEENVIDIDSLIDSIVPHIPLANLLDECFEKCRREERGAECYQGCRDKYERSPDERI